MKRILLWVFGAGALLLLLAVIGFEIRHQLGNRRAANIIEEFEVVSVHELGTTKTLRILPLIDFYTSDPALQTEVGVSYLVETDQNRILFDLAQNTEFENPRTRNGHRDCSLVSRFGGRR